MFKTATEVGSLFLAVLLNLTLFQGANAVAAGPNDDEAYMLQRRSHQWPFQHECLITGVQSKLPPLPTMAQFCSVQVLNPALLAPALPHA